jgi:hypothetical protein
MISESKHFELNEIIDSGIFVWILYLAVRTVSLSFAFLVASSICVAAVV